MIELKLSVVDSLIAKGPRINGASTNEETRFKGVVTDTRKECEGSLFIALKGERFDGHEYLELALQKGAVCAVVEQLVDCNITQIVVEDTLKAYAQIARYWRQQVPAKIIAITGSNGKTTVKEMLNSILSGYAKTSATVGNFNNEIGVPQTLCELSQDDEFAIIEMGANHTGEIKRLVLMTEPNVVFVNNAAEAHLEGFGSIEGVKKAKGEIYKYAPTSSIAIFNADDEAVEQWIDSSVSTSKISFSLNEHTAQIQASIKNQSLVFQAEHLIKPIQLKLLGEHNFRNALAAASIAIALNIDVLHIQQGLEAYPGFKGRFNALNGPHGSTVIDDSYNANPASFKAGIKVLCAMSGEPWLAMGDMAELGNNEQQQHDDVVLYAQQAGVNALFSKGKYSKISSRLMGQKSQNYDSFDVMSESIKLRLHKDVNLLVKGSRSAQMDQLVSQLTAGDH